MKKFSILLVCVTIITTNCVMGQDSIQDSTQDIFEYYLGYQRYDLHFKAMTMGMKYLAGTKSKWSFGGGVEYELPLGPGIDKTADNILPVNSFSVEDGRLGAFASVAYHLPKGLAFLDCYIGLNDLAFQAYDERCKIDHDPGITHWYHIKRADGKKWGPSTTISMRLSYLLPVKIMGVRLMAGYDITPRANPDYINDNTEISSSDWDDFETYYGHPSVNLYEASETVRNACSMSHFYFGICISLFCESHFDSTNSKVDWTASH